MHLDSLIDTKAFFERVGSDPVLAREVIDLFFAEAPKLLAEIQHAIADQDRARLAAAAHAIGGSIGNFSVGHAYAVAQELEKIGLTHDLSRAPLTFSSLQHEIALVISELETLSKEGFAWGKPK